MSVSCIGCFRVLEAGDRYIEDTVSGFINCGTSEDSLMADLFGGKDGKVLFCEDCTEQGGNYLFETVYEESA